MPPKVHRKPVAASPGLIDSADELPPRPWPSHAAAASSAVAAAAVAPLPGLLDDSDGDDARAAAAGSAAGATAGAEKRPSESDDPATDAEAEARAARDDPESFIDGVTAEHLVSGRYVSVRSPDGSLVMRYNTRTLLRVARARGQWMQPPHFREPMAVALQRRVEAVEGKQEFGAPARFGGEAVAFHAAALRLHQRVLLAKADVYLCPLCYAAASGGDAEADPLEVLLARLPGRVPAPPGGDPSEPQGAADGDSGAGAAGGGELHMSAAPTRRRREQLDELRRMCFATGPVLRAHVRALHGGAAGIEVGESKLRRVVDQMLVARRHRLEREGRAHRAVDSRQAYWAADAKYNTARYNWLVSLVHEQPPGAQRRLATLRLAAGLDWAALEAEPSPPAAAVTDRRQQKRSRSGGDGASGSAAGSNSGDSDATAASDDDDASGGGSSRSSSSSAVSTGKYDRALAARDKIRRQGPMALADAATRRLSLAVAESAQRRWHRRRGDEDELPSDDSFIVRGSASGSSTDSDSSSSSSGASTASGGSSVSASSASTAEESPDRAEPRRGAVRLDGAQLAAARQRHHKTRRDAARCSIADLVRPAAAVTPHERMLMERGATSAARGDRRLDGGFRVGERDDNDEDDCVRTLNLPSPSRLRQASIRDFFPPADIPRQRSPARAARPAERPLVQGDIRDYMHDGGGRRVLGARRSGGSDAPAATEADPLLIDSD